MDSITLYKNFHNLITSALKINVQCFQYPYLQIKDSDRGFRSMLWADFDYIHGNENGDISHFEPNHISIIRSNLKFTNILYRFPKALSDDLIILGPFMQEKANNHFLMDIIKDQHLKSNMMPLIQEYYETLPLVDEETVLLTLIALINSFLSDYPLPEVDYFDFSTAQLPVSEPEHAYIQDHRLKNIEKRISLEAQVFNYMKAGNIIGSKGYLQSYIQSNPRFVSQRISELKRQLIIFNTQCADAMKSDKVHPFYIENLAHQLFQQIENDMNRESLLKMPYTIVERYSLLSQKYSFASYSIDVRKAMTYIDVNQDTAISLKEIADYLGKNASTFSAKFKRETGLTVTEFIKESKMNTAIQLLITTDYAINDIAAMVGFYDFSYFCKLFKQHTQMTPKHYREQSYTQNMSKK